MEVSARNDEGRTPLHWAVEGGHYAAAQTLLARNIDAAVKEKGTEMTALDYAQQKAYDEPENRAWKKIVELLQAKR